ncbi:MAG TPA: M48 family metallopeptidase, partial [Bacteroidota bacterium]
LASWAAGLVSFPYGAFVLFAAAVGLLEGVLTLPFRFFSGYVVEHRYGLSNQSLSRWAWERVKGMLVGAPLGLLVLVLLYYCVSTWPTLWWLPLGTALTLLSVVMARLAPVLILPLFYRLTPLPDGALKERLVELCERARLSVRGVFSFNLSKNTKKANAGFTGIGRAKRVILGDTLVDEFTDDEIETVFAHELGHYHHHHIAVGIVIGTLSTFAGLFVTSLLYRWSLSALGFTGPADLGALPLLGIWLALYGLATTPAGNVLSRRHEYQADRYAIAATGKPAAFVSALSKLAVTNLADPEPSPLVEFLLHSHPSIRKRIRRVESL